MGAIAQTIAKTFGFGGAGIATAGTSNARPNLATILRNLQAAANEAFPKVDLAADAAATDVVAERTIFRARGTVTLTAMRVNMSAAVTGDNANNAVITIRRRDATGGNAVTVATMTTNVANGNFVAFSPKAFASLANTTLTAGQQLTLQVAKGGTGVQLPAAFVDGDVQSVVT